MTIKGTVTEGNKKGTTLGYPTANIVISPLVDITEGVYYATVRIDGYNFDAMAYIGTHPTVGEADRRLLEVNIFNFSGNLYGSRIEVTLLDFIRGEQKFSSPEELINAIDKDKEIVLSYI